MMQRLRSFAIFVALLVLVAGGGSLLAQPNEPPPAKRWTFTPLPLPSYNDDIGFIYGLRGTFVFYDVNAQGEPYKPYQMEIWAQYLASTKGYEDHAFSVDMVDFFDLGFRVKLRGGYSRTLNAQYYGVGNYQDIQRIGRIRRGETPVGDNVPRQRTIIQGADLTEEYGLHHKLGDEINLNENVLFGGPAAVLNQTALNPGRRILRERQDKYYNYDRVRPYLELSAEDWFGSSNFKWFVGFRGQRFRINSYYGGREDGQAEYNSPTLIDVEQPYGYDAVRDNKPRFVNGARVALAYDSRPREREPNPNEGIFTDLHYEGVGHGTGSDYSFQRVTYTWRQYIEVLPSIINSWGHEAVFAYRLIGQQTFGDVPFWEAGRIYNMNPNEGAEGLGGSSGIRGYPSNQFVDKTMALGNFEGRYNFARTQFLGGMDIQLMYFYDIGRVAPSWREWDLHGLHKAWGPGIGLVWKKTTIVTIFQGRSQYESFTALKLSHMF